MSKEKRDPFDRLVESWEETLNSGVFPKLTKKSLIVVKNRKKCEDSDVKNFEQWSKNESCLKRLEEKLIAIGKRKHGTIIDSVEIELLLKDVTESLEDN